VDLDVHQGNGTAEIFRSNPNVFTFPLMENHYPFKRNSDLDIAFNDNTTDDEFLQTIASVIPKLIETQNLILSFI
jgi:acetoin utilization deacetylase AcuC-like enzyme